MNTACCGVCVSQASFIEEYRELYACILSYDEKTLTGTAVGFDELGKLESIYYKTPVDDIYHELIDKFNLENYKPDEEGYERGLEFGFLNLT